MKSAQNANIAATTGTLLMLLAFIWGGLVMYRQYQNIAQVNLLSLTGDNVQY